MYDVDTSIYNSGQFPYYAAPTVPLDNCPHSRSHLSHWSLSAGIAYAFLHIFRLVGYIGVLFKKRVIGPAILRQRNILYL